MHGYMTDPHAECSPESYARARGALSCLEGLSAGASARDNLFSICDFRSLKRDKFLFVVNNESGEGISRVPAVL